MAQQQRFSSHLATLLTMAGLAIGLGNVWRFPYMMGQHGGSAFVFIYILFIVVLAVPALSSEWSLGRATRSGLIAAFQKAYGQKAGLYTGIFLTIGVFIALTYYSLVVGNVIFTAWFSAQHGLSPQTVEAYQAGLGKNGLQYLFGLGVVLMSLWVVQRGLRGGIELVNKALVPAFALISIYMVFVALNVDGAVDQLKQFIKPDFSRAGPEVWFAAMGQACFSVGLSGVLGVMYGTYLRREERIVPTAVATGLMDTGAAIMASLFVVPVVLVFGLDLAAGPTLLFNTLPELFGVMPGGRWLGPIFLSSWALVAMLSIICTFDAIANSFADLTGTRFSKNQWMITVALALCAVMFPIAMNPHWIGTLDLVVGSGMFMLGSLLAVLAVGWGLGEAALRTQIRLGISPRMEDWVVFWIRWVTPIALAAIMLSFVYKIIFGSGH